MVGDGEARGRPARVMPWWVVVLGLLVAVLLGGLVTWWLLGEAQSGTSRAQLRIDAIRTGLAVVAGTGGAIALLFAARRQWLSERAQRHAERVAEQERVHQERAQAHVEAVAGRADLDAMERRITDLYIKAVDQLGNDRAAVRLGGLYALERLARDYPVHRATIADVICAYLRMPRSDGDTEPRRTAQAILTRHLRPEDGAYWSGLVVRLAGAALIDFEAAGCRFDDADFTGATFDGRTSFAAAEVRGELRLDRCAFRGPVDLRGLRCHRPLELTGTGFDGPVDADGAEFGGDVVVGDSCAFAGTVSFRSARFGGLCQFDRVRFVERVYWRQAVFERGASFEHAVFAGGATFRGARFADTLSLRWAAFEGDAGFVDVSVGGDLNVDRASFSAMVHFSRATLRGDTWLRDVRASRAADRTWPAGYREVPAGDNRVTVEPDGSLPSHH